MSTTYVSSQKVDDLEAVLDDPDCQELLAVVAAVHHEGVDESLDDGALGLAETLGGEAAGGVGKELGHDGDVVLQGEVGDDHVVAVPLVEQLDVGHGCLGGDGGRDGHWRGFFSPIVRHDFCKSAQWN